MKHRTAAANLVTDGKIRLNHARIAKPSHEVKPGDVLTMTLDATIRVVRVLASAERRGPASAACLLYEELTIAQNTSFPSEKTGA